MIITKQQIKQRLNLCYKRLNDTNTDPDIKVWEQFVKWTLIGKLKEGDY